MFDMKKHSGNAGYKLSIVYHTITGKFELTGFSRDFNKARTVVHSSQDGAVVVFDSLEEVIKDLQNYKEN